MERLILWRRFDALANDCRHTAARRVSLVLQLLQRLLGQFDRKGLHRMDSISLLSGSQYRLDNRLKLETSSFKPVWSKPWLATLRDIRRREPAVRPRLPQSDGRHTELREQVAASPIDHRGDRIDVEVPTHRRGPLHLAAVARDGDEPLARPPPQSRAQPVKAAAFRQLDVRALVDRAIEAVIAVMSAFFVASTASVNRSSRMALENRGLPTRQLSIAPSRATSMTADESPPAPR